MPLTHRNDLVQAFVFDGSHKPFRMGVQIRTSSRQANRSATRIPHALPEPFGEQGIPVMDQELLPDQKSVKGVRQVSPYLVHPDAIRAGGDPGYMDPSSVQLHDEQNVIANEPPRSPYLHVEESRRSQSGTLLAQPPLRTLGSVGSRRALREARSAAAFTATTTSE